MNDVASTRTLLSPQREWIARETIRQASLCKVQPDTVGMRVQDDLCARADFRWRPGEHATTCDRDPAVCGSTPLKQERFAVREMDMNIEQLSASVVLGASSPIRNDASWRVTLGTRRIARSLVEDIADVCTSATRCTHVLFGIRGTA